MTVPFPKARAFIWTLLALIVGGFLFLIWRAFGLATVSNFADCQRYPGAITQQTDPPTCVLPNGKGFPE